MANEGSLDGVRCGSPWRIAGWGAAAGLILLPLVAMQYSSEVVWTGSDFVFAIVMLGSVGLGLELAVRTKNRLFTMAVAIALLTSFLQIWIAAAVGIIGNENEDANLLFLCVVGVALVGSAIASLRPARMAVAMIAAAIAQAAVPLIAPVFGDSTMAAIWAPEVIILTIVFTAGWLASARLFRMAA